MLPVLEISDTKNLQRNLRDTPNFLLAPLSYLDRILSVLKYLVPLTLDKDETHITCFNELKILMIIVQFLLVDLS